MELAKYKFVDDSKEAFMEILTVISYEKNKDEFISKVTEKIGLLAISNLMETLDSVKKADALAKFKAQDKNIIIQMTKEWFTENQLKNTYLKAFQTTAEDFIKNMGEELSEDQKSKINAILQKPELKAQ